MSDKQGKKERKPRPSLTKDQIGELKGWLDAVEAKRQELKEKHPTFRRLETFMEAAGLAVSTWHAWNGEEPTSPSFFDFRAVLRLVGMDVDVIVVPSPGAALSLEAGGGGSALLRNTTMSHLVRVLERLSKEDQQKILEKALEAAIRLEKPEPAKLAERAADTVPQQPTAEQRAARGRRTR